MTNPMFNPQPNYSGVTIQIANPAVNVSPTPNGFNQNIPQGVALRNGNYAACPQACYYECYPQGIDTQNRMPGKQDQLSGSNSNRNRYSTDPNSHAGVSNPQENRINPNYGMENFNNNSAIQKDNESNYNDSGYAQAYPSSYYLNDFSKVKDTISDNNNVENRSTSNSTNTSTNDEINTNGFMDKSGIKERAVEKNFDQNGENYINNSEPNYNAYDNASDSRPYIAGENLEIMDNNDGSNSTSRNRRVDPEAGISPYKDYADTPKIKEPEDMTASKNIIGALDERNAEIKEAKKNTKEQKIVALTDEYIMSLENYLNNPNDEIRLMASKEILTRLDEDKDRYDDAALNALLNKMLQDPSKLIRLAALSAFASQLASGNDYTVQLLQNIQSNPNADKEDALQAADILLKMSAGVEVKNVPESDVKREQYKMKPRMAK